MSPNALDNVKFSFSGGDRVGRIPFVHLDTFLLNLLIDSENKY